MTTDGKKAARNRKDKEMFKMVKSIGFTADDSELMEAINEYAHQLRGISPKAAIRNFLLEKLPEATRQLRERFSERRVG